MLGARRRRRTTIVTQENDSDSDSSGGRSDVEDDFEAGKQQIADFETLRQNKIGHTEECWLCKFKFRPDATYVKDPVMKKMASVYNTNVGTIPPEEMAVLFMAIYDEEYRKKEIERGNYDVMVMTHAKFVTHFRFHIFSHQATLENTIQDLVVMEAELKNATFVIVHGKDGVARKLPVEKNMNIYFKLVHQKTATVLAANQLKRLKKG